MSICQNCKNIVPVGMTRCDVCGAEVSSTQPQNQQVEQTVQQPQSIQTMQHAGLIHRGCAFIIDALIIVVPISIVAAIFISEKYEKHWSEILDYATKGTPLSPEISASITTDAMILTVAVAIVGLLYFTISEGRRQATIGKKICNIRVIRVNGTPVDYNVAFFRNLFRLLWFIPYSVGTLFLIMDMISVLLRNQRIGDTAAKTYVVRR